MDLAEDLAQTAFVLLIERRPDAPDGWLYVVAANLARDAVRGDRCRADRLRLLAHGCTDVVGPSAESALLAVEARDQLRAALGQLSERDRTLLELCAEGGGVSHPCDRPSQRSRLSFKRTQCGSSPQRGDH